MKGPSQESLHVIVVYFVVVVLLLMPRVADAVIPAGGHRKIVAGGGGSKRSTASKSYAVIFDAGSSGSRVHVYCFDENLDLVPIGDDIELFVQTKPGLSSYANDPQAAADSLIPLLEEAESLVPAELRSKTPVKLGATAGLRALGTETSDQILQVVKDLLEEKSSLKYKPEWVTVIDGTEEGAFEWVTVNYLLGNLGKESSNTVGAVDLGGGSVQMAYAISEKDAANAPRNSDGEDTYVKELFVRGTKYYLYVHSYLNYGLLAARAEILKAGNESYSYCILDGYQGSYTYSGVEYEVSASPSGSSFTKCRSDVVTALKIDEPCTYMNCTFNGVWNGGVGDGLKNVYLASFFHSRANEVGLINPSAPNGKATPAAFEEAAKSVCKLNMADAKTAYPLVKEEDLPYLCMDLVYQYTLLVDGFGLEPRQEITLVAQMEYGDYLVEVAWPLGSALELISSDDALQVRGPLYLS